MTATLTPPLAAAPVPVLPEQRTRETLLMELADVGRDMIARVGGKGANLGEMMHASRKSVV